MSSGPTEPARRGQGPEAAGLTPFSRSPDCGPHAAAPCERTLVSVCGLGGCAPPPRLPMGADFGEPGAGR